MKALARYYTNPNYCLNCETKIEVSEKESPSAAKGRKFCGKACFNILTKGKTKPCIPKGLTKQQLLDSRKGNRHSAFTSLHLHAREVFYNSGEVKECVICGYNKHIQICHIKAVKDFESSATVLEINSKENLIALCPNHHWEFDNKLLSANEKSIIEKKIAKNAN